MREEGRITSERGGSAAKCQKKNHPSARPMKSKEKKKLPPLTRKQNPYCPITHSKTAPSRN
jgi:hypothetical protein